MSTNEKEVPVDASTQPEKQPNFTLNATPYVDMTDSDKTNMIGLEVPILSHQKSTIFDLRERAPTFNPEDEWQDTLAQAYAFTHPHDNQLEKTANNPDSDWTQRLQNGDTILSAGKHKFTGGSNRLNPEQIVLSVRTRMGLGSTIHLPLYHSGIWVTLKPPGEDEILNLYRDMTMDKVRLGRAHYGLLFSGNEVVYANRIINMFMSNILETSVKDIADIRDLILVQDLQAIAWGLARTIWPNGFPYSRSELDEKGNPLRLLTQKIDVSKIFWVNRRAFTQTQLTHLSKQFGMAMTVEQVRAYQEEFGFNKSKVDLENGIVLSIETPTVMHYLESGQRWIDTVVQSADQALGKIDEETVRSNHIQSLAKVSRMRQYVHYVKSASIDDNEFTDAPIIDGILDTLSASTEATKKFFESIRQHIDGSVIAMVAVPSVSAAEDKMASPDFPHLIPIDAQSVFFHLAAQRAATIITRT